MALIDADLGAHLIHSPLYSTHAANGSTVARAMQVHDWIAAADGAP
jgi:hypothetical protein